jgi:GNAT superfamily N-acetyltransferase
MTEQMPPTIRAMTPADIAAAVALKNTAGWNQLPADWERFLAWEPDGCFLAQIDGALVGTATTISYPGRFGWIGMVLVHADYRRRGIGTALMEACIAYLEPLVPAIRLDATPMGRPLYQTLGFADEYGLERWAGLARAPGATEAQPLTAELLPAIAACDALVFGADRARVLSRLAVEPEVGAWVLLHGGVACGYVMLRPGANAWYVGPLVANEPEAAEQLLRSALQSVAGQPVLIDPLLPNPHAIDLARSVGLEHQRPFTRMCRGRNDFPGTPESIYSPAGPEIG